MNYRIRQIGITASTNDDAKRAAEADEDEGLVVWALKQTAGRGRHGRQWESPEGNLYCSVLLRPKITAQEFGHFSFVASLALYDTIRDFLPQANITLKWPNDVLLNGKKVSGILLESGESWLVVGIGLNIAHYPADALYPATSLQAEGLRQGDLSKMLEALLNHLRHWYETIQNGDFSPIRTAWLDRAQKGPVTVRLPNRTVEGVFAGLDDNGHLRLRLPDGSEDSIATGDVFFA